MPWDQHVVLGNLTLKHHRDILKMHIRRMNLNGDNALCVWKICLQIIQSQACFIPYLQFLNNEFYTFCLIYILLYLPLTVLFNVQAYLHLLPYVLLNPHQGPLCLYYHMILSLSFTTWICIYNVPLDDKPLYWYNKKSFNKNGVLCNGSQYIHTIRDWQAVCHAYNGSKILYLGHIFSWVSWTWMIHHTIVALDPKDVWWPLPKVVSNCTNDKHLCPSNTSSLDLDDTCTSHDDDGCPWLKVIPLKYRSHGNCSQKSCHNCIPPAENVGDI